MEKSNAIKFLTEKFRLAPHWECEKLIQLASDVGIGRNVIFEAKGNLLIHPKQVIMQDGRKVWEWRASEGWPPKSATTSS